MSENGEYVCFISPQPKLIDSDYLFYLTNSPTLKGTQFTIIWDKRKHHHIWEVETTECLAFLL